MTKQGQWAEKIRWNADGLISAVAQDADTGELLMLAWMNREALQKTIESNTAHYFSRSRQKLWRKGEESGHTQTITALYLDCDGDAVLLKVRQHGVACHTGRRSCFYNRWEAHSQQWVADTEVLIAPETMYPK